MQNLREQNFGGGEISLIKGISEGPVPGVPPGLGKWPLLLPGENKPPELLRQSPGYPKGSIRCIGLDATPFGDQ